MRKEKLKLMRICTFIGYCPDQYKKRRRMKKEEYIACGRIKTRCSKKIVSPARRGFFTIPEIIREEVTYRTHAILGFFEEY